MQLAYKLLPVRAGQDGKQAIPNLRRRSRINPLCGAPQQDYAQAFEYRACMSAAGENLLCSRDEVNYGRPGTR
jgi:hypothetical protein